MPAKFIHTADVHLTREDPFRLNVLSWIIFKAKQIADGVIIAGDLFENDTEASFLRGKIRDLFEKIAPIPVLIIPGNHDVLAYSSETYYGSNVTVFSQPSRIDVKGVRITGFPFHSELDFSRYVEEIESGPRPDLIIAHGTLYDRKSSGIYTELEDEARYMPIYSWQIEGKAGYLALGHYHSRFTHLTFGETQVVYPGAPVATSRRSIGERSVALVEFDKEGNILTERIPVDISLHWERMEWMVFPGKEEEKLIEIEKEIEGRSSGKIMLEGRIKGSIKMNESEFIEKVREIEEKYRSNFKRIHLFCEIKHWTQLAQNPTIALFMENLEEKTDNEIMKERALELTLSALERLRK